MQSREAYNSELFKLYIEEETKLSNKHSEKALRIALSSIRSSWSFTVDTSSWRSGRRAHSRCRKWRDKYFIDCLLRISLPNKTKTFSVQASREWHCETIFECIIIRWFRLKNARRSNTCRASRRRTTPTSIQLALMHVIQRIIIFVSFALQRPSQLRQRRTTTPKGLYSSRSPPIGSTSPTRPALRWSAAPVAIRRRKSSGFAATGPPSATCPGFAKSCPTEISFFRRSGRKTIAKTSTHKLTRVWPRTNSAQSSRATSMSELVSWDSSRPHSAAHLNERIRRRCANKSETQKTCPSRGRAASRRILSLAEPTNSHMKSELKATRRRNAGRWSDAGLFRHRALKSGVYVRLIIIPETTKQQKRSSKITTQTILLLLFNWVMSRMKFLLVFIHFYSFNRALTLNLLCLRILGSTTGPHDLLKSINAQLKRVNRFPCTRRRHLRRCLGKSLLFSR